MRLVRPAFITLCSNYTLRAGEIFDQVCEEREGNGPSVRSISFEEFKKSLIKVAILSRGLESVFDGLSEADGGLE